MKIFFNEPIDHKNLVFSKKRIYNDYTFVKIDYKDKHEKIPFIIQTPQLFIPYGFDNESRNVCISFHNKENDINTDKLLLLMENIQKHIHGHIESNYTNFTCKHFLKSSQYSECMNPKITSSTVHFGHNKDKINKCECFSYGSVIVHLSGIWFGESECWICWNILQTRVDDKLELSTYAFKEKNIPPPPPLPKNFSKISPYHKMLKVGIPKAAVLHKMKQDNNLPSDSVPKIDSKMLLSVKLKKSSREIKKHKKDNRIPNTEQLKSALRTLKKTRTTKINPKDYYKDPRIPTIDELLKSKIKLLSVKMK